jgi:serine/threonine-protein kinase
VSLRKFGNYEILHELKSGGMGSVLIGRRRGPGAFEQLVAIKTIRPEFAASEQVRSMFLDEARILASLNHPAIAHVHDFGEDGGTLYMVMEYVAGIPFRDFGELTPPPTIVARAIAEASRGLHAAHEVRDLTGTVLNLVHRDISPDNLMLTYDGHVKVIDFGIALVKKDRQAKVTEFGTVKGKPPYMSPEQVKNDAMDRRSDVFSLGVVMWELLTHELLFDGDSLYAIALAVANREIPMPSTRLGGARLPLGLDAVVMNALDRSPDTRTPTAAALAEQLETVIATTGDETLQAWAERELAGPRDKHRTWLAGIAAGPLTPVTQLGRPSGEVTQLAPGALGDPPAPRVASPPVDARGDTGIAMQTHLPAERADGRPTRRRMMPFVIVALVLALAVIGVLLATGPGTQATAVDAGVVAQRADARAAIDASIVVPPTPDAAPAPADAAELVAPPDARAHTTHADAAIRPPPVMDAAVVHAKPDAAETPTLAGAGTLKLLSRPEQYANVSIDGALAIPTPQFHLAVPAGKHTIQFQDPKTGTVIYTTTVVVADKQAVTVQPPAK